MWLQLLRWKNAVPSSKTALFEDGWPKIHCPQKQPYMRMDGRKSKVCPQKPSFLRMDGRKSKVCPQKQPFLRMDYGLVSWRSFRNCIALRKIQLAQQANRWVQKSKHSIPLLHKKRRHFYLRFSYPEPGSNRHSLAATGVWDQRVYRFRHPGNFW